MMLEDWLQDHVVRARDDLVVGVLEAQRTSVRCFPDHLGRITRLFALDNKNRERVIEIDWWVASLAKKVTGLPQRFSTSAARSSASE